MKSHDEEPTDEDRIYGADLPPRHESYARSSANGTLVGFIVFLVLAGLFVLWIGLRR